MLENKNLEKLLVAEWALEALKMLPQEKKEELILVSLENQLYKQSFGWEAQKIFEEYAKQYAAEHLAKPVFQEKIREKAYKAVDEVFEKLLTEFTKQFAEDLKWTIERVAGKYK